MSGELRQAWCICANTYRETMRGNLLYSIIAFEIGVVALSSFFGTVTIGDQALVIKDFGLFSISIAGVAFAIISGSALLHKELSRKTIYNVLAKAVSRRTFLLGKFLGMLLTVSVMVSLMGVGLSAFLTLLTGKLDLTIGLAVIHIILELSIVCAAAIFFSSVVVTPMLSGIFTFGIFLAGRSVAHLGYFVPKDGGTAVKSIIELATLVLPNLGLVVADTFGISELEREIPRLSFGVLYAFSYSGVLLILANAIFKRRDFN